MKQNFRLKWKVRWGMWKLRLKIMYLEAAAFVRTYPPFKYFFYTLTYFELQEREKRTLDAQKQKTPYLNHDDVQEIREQADRKHEQAQLAELEAIRRSTKEADELRFQTCLKMEQFRQFLLEQVETGLAIQYANKIPELVDPEDYKGTVERINTYIDSIMQQHQSDRSTK